MMIKDKAIAVIAVPMLFSYEYGPTDEELKIIYVITDTPSNTVPFGKQPWSAVHIGYLPSGIRNADGFEILNNIAALIGNKDPKIHGSIIESDHRTTSLEQFKEDVLLAVKRSV